MPDGANAEDRIEPHSVASRQRARLGSDAEYQHRLRLQYLFILAAVFILLGIAVIVIAQPVASKNLSQLLESLGLSFVAFGVTAIIFTYFTNQLFEGQVAKGIDDHMGKILEQTREGLAQVTMRFDNFVPLFSNCRTLGLENVYLTRQAALRDYSRHLNATLEEARSVTEAGAAKPVLWFVSSSMKGFIETSEPGFDGKLLLKEAADLVKKDQLELRILMTDPKHGDDRAAQEGRNEGDIPTEIKAHLAILKVLGVRCADVRFVRRTPTVFAIATNELMLLNPYPYRAEAFRCFTITVRKTPSAEANPTSYHDIYDQYWQHHFLDPWDDADDVEAVWDGLGSLRGRFDGMNAHSGGALRARPTR